MRRTISTLLLLAVAWVQASARQSGAGKASQLMGQARAALGGDAKVREVQSLVVTGDYRRSANQEQAGTMELDFLLPDKYERSESMNVVAGIQITIINAVNGNQVWSDSKTSSPGGAQVMVMRPGSSNLQPTDAQAQEFRAEFARNLLVFLLTAPSTLPLQFNYAGEAVAQDGKADVIDVSGPGGFAARLFLDKSSHRPLMISYQGTTPGVSVNKTTAQASGAGDIDKIVKEAQKNNQSRRKAEIQVRISDYRDVNGVLMPYHLSSAVDGQTYEEFEIKKIKINPQGLKADKFEKK